MPVSPLPTDRMDPTSPSFEALVRACTAPSALLDAQGTVLSANSAFVQRLRLDAGARLDGLDVAPGEGGVSIDIDGGRLHVRALDATHRLAQWLEAPVDRTAEQRQLQMFADTVAHDLRAPLRSIDSFARLLEERAAAKLDAAERMHLSRIRAATTRMSGLLTALGELSRAASAAMQRSDVDLSLLAEWAIAELHDAEPERDVVVHVQPDLHVLGDERLLRQMLRELLGNAWTFTRHTSPAEIDVRGERVGNMLRMSIRDTGAGFDMQYAHKLFQPFQRLHGAEQGAGHGLGLAIAQRIAQRHGGGVTAESVEGQGSTFTVELPVADDE